MKPAQLQQTTWISAGGRLALQELHPHKDGTRAELSPPEAEELAHDNVLRLCLARHPGCASLFPLRLQLLLSYSATVPESRGCQRR